MARMFPTKPHAGMRNRYQTDSNMNVIKTEIPKQLKQNTPKLNMDIGSNRSTRIRHNRNRQKSYKNESLATHRRFNCFHYTVT